MAGCRVGDGAKGLAGTGDGAKARRCHVGGTAGTAAFAPRL
jgi:hypothetical protein